MIRQSIVQRFSHQFYLLICKDQFFTLSIAHNTENVDEVDCMKLDVRGRPSDEARYLEGKGRAKDGFFDEVRSRAVKFESFWILFV
jgi:hypothetical protein